MQLNTTGFQTIDGNLNAILTVLVPISIADINDNDNFHQLCFSTFDEIVEISMMASTVEDLNQGPNLYSEIDVSSSIEENLSEKGNEIYPNPFSEEIFFENLLVNENFIIYGLFGRNIIVGKCLGNVKIPETNSGILFDHPKQHQSDNLQVN